MSEKIENAIEIIDSCVEQSTNLLSLDTNSAVILVNEILNEEDFLSKLSKVLHLFLDRLKIQSLNQPVGFNKESYSELLDLNSSIPSNPKYLIGWLKKYLIDRDLQDKEYQEAICHFQQNLLKCQNHLKIAKKMLNEYELNEKGENDNQCLTDKSRISSLINENSLLKAQIKELQTSNKNNELEDLGTMNLSLKNQIKNYQLQLSEQNSISNTLKAKISSDSAEMLNTKEQNDELKKRISVLTQENASFHEKHDDELNHMINENKKMRSKLNQKRRKIKDLIESKNERSDHIKVELNNQKNKYKKNYVLFKKLNHLDCDCFKGDEKSVVEHHISLHKTIENLKNQNDSLNRQMKTINDIHNSTIQTEINDLHKKCEELNHQIQRMDQKNKEISNENISLCHKISVLEVEKKSFLEIKNQSEKIQQEYSLLSKEYGALKENTEIKERSKKIGDFSKSKENEVPLIKECSGCLFDVTKLKARFESLDDSINNLEYMLTQQKVVNNDK